MTVKDAGDAYVVERRNRVSPGMVKYWKAQTPPLVAYFKTPLKSITLADVEVYQNKRLNEGRAPKTVNGEIERVETGTQTCETLASLRGLPTSR
jgi:hypothetical protein